MTQEVLKKIYQLLLTEPHAPTVCAQLERIAREALAEHAMRETQRLGQEIEQEPVAHLWECIGRWSAYLVSNGKQANCAPPSWLVDAVNNATTPPQRKPLSAEQVSEICAEWTDENGNTGSFGRRQIARAIEAAHGIKENT